MADRLVRSYRADLEIRSAGDGRTVIGRAAPFDSPTEIREWHRSFTETIRRGAFAKTVAERGQRVKLLHGHDETRMPIGRATRLEERADGLWGEFRVSQTGPGDEALELVRDGTLDCFSVGFYLVPGGERWNPPHTERELTEVKLVEVSLTAFPAYETATIAAVRTTTLSSSGPGLAYWQARLRAFESEF